ncbi:hypothetical protein GQ600_710 [Phytophthora cactorum]|nr:hypothetical protein GQ600_710 [Phytophthora cactorum]
MRSSYHHVDREEDSLSAKYHEMHCIMTKCGTASGGTCRCRYKILACEEQVQNFVKGWRRRNKPDRMVPVIDICRQCMCDRTDRADSGTGSLLVFCDVQDVNGLVEPALGTGSEAKPFRQLIFRNLYDLHFTATEEEVFRKRGDMVNYAHDFAGSSTIHVSYRFGCKDLVFPVGKLSTPTGYAATNDPVETYHYSLKLVNDRKRATPTELITRLDLSCIVYVASMILFIDEPQVSKRLKALYRQADKKKLMEVYIVHRLQNRDLVLVSLRQRHSNYTVRK